MTNDLGRIDSVFFPNITGWVRGNHSLCVWVDGEFIGKLMPEHFIASGSDISTTSRQFVFPFSFLNPTSLLNDSIKIELRSADSLNLQVDVKCFPTQELFKAPETKGNSASYLGCIDEISAERIRGWVLHKKTPNQFVYVYLFLNKRFSGQYLANEYRRDLLKLQSCDGYAGFNIDISKFTKAWGFSRNVEVVVADESGWRVPCGPHARKSMPSDLMDGFRRWCADKIELVLKNGGIEPYVKRVYDLAIVPNTRMPSAQSPDYVLLSIECLRHEIAVLADDCRAKGSISKENRKKLAQLEWQMERLIPVANLIAASQAIIEKNEGAINNISRKEN